MKLVRTLSSFTDASLREQLRTKLVGVTIGNFDALHLGHQRLFDVLNSRLSARPARERMKVLVSFWPHPRQVLSGMKRRDLPLHPEFFTVCSLRQKLELIEAFGFDLCYLIRFQPSFASLTPEQFISRHIVSTCQPSVVVVGDDWAFGKGRAGNPDMLRELGKDFGFQVDVVPALRENGNRISTSAVKDAVRAADFAKLKVLLGRPYWISSRVFHGDARGRELGFPTANLECPGVLLPPDGIYAVWAKFDGRRLPAAAYIGSRPTFGPGRKVIEVYLIDQENFDLYGKRLKIQFASQIRPDRRFDSKEELIAAITKDVEEARRRLT